MTLDWQEKTQVLSPERSLQLYTAECTGVTDIALKQAVSNCVQKAIEHLHSNIQNDSMYLLFEWSKTNALLTAVVTDELKQNDANIVIQCQFQKLSQKPLQTEDEMQQYADNIHFWIRDYLTTDNAFLHYSLIAIYHDSSRDNTRLL